MFGKVTSIVFWWILPKDFYKLYFSKLQALVHFFHIPNTSFDAMVLTILLFWTYLCAFAQI
jgi:hypothetical protein